MSTTFREEGKGLILESSSGRRIFPGILRKAKPKGCHVYITGLNDSLKGVFMMTGFTNLFEYK